MSDSIGQPISRLDGFAKVTGNARYSGDWPQEHLAHAVIFQSTIPAGKIRSFDLKDAKAVPGVIEIMTFENAPKAKKGKGEPGSGPGEAFVPLQDNVVHYNGQHLGCVIAESLEAAMQAARMISVHYTPARAELNMDDMVSHSYVISEMPGLGKINMDNGNVKKGFKKSVVIVDQVYSTPIENHNPMEPSATLAIYKDGAYKLYDATQGVSAGSKVLGEAMGVDPEKFQVISKFLGGGFGCKGSAWPHQFIAAMATKLVNRPVKLVLTRQQMFSGVGHRARTLQKMTLGADQEGVLQAIKHEVYNNTSMNKDFSERSGSPTCMMYKCENIEVTHHLKKFNYQVPTFMRAPGESSGSFALESAMDELAHQLKMDPIDLRLKNYATEDAKEKKPFSSKSLDKCYREGAKAFGWSERKPNPGAHREGDYLIGYGMATATYPAKRFPATAEVKLTSDGKAQVRSATQDLGTGSYTVFAQIAADELGMDFKNIDFDLGDSAYPKAGVSGGSTSLSSVGSAIKSAGDHLKSQLAELATNDKQSPLHGLSAAEMGFSEGRIHSTKDSKNGETYADLMRRNKKDVIVAKGETKTEDEESKKFAGHSFGAQFAKVRIHRLTGEVRTEKLLGAFAAGKIVNPKTAKSQFMGGMIFGLGMALMEHTQVDSRSGRLVIKDLADYHVPIQADVPEMEILMIDEVDTHINPIGTKGIGEIGIVGAAAAIANAVFNATGVRVRDLPILPEKVALSPSLMKA